MCVKCSNGSSSPATPKLSYEQGQFEHTAFGREKGEAKFRDCVSFAATPLAAADVDRAVALIRDLENVSDVTEIMQLLMPADVSSGVTRSAVTTSFNDARKEE